MEHDITQGRSIGRAVLTGEITATEAVKYCLDRIERFDSQVAAFECLRPEPALAEAAACDRGTRSGVLKGLPFAVKDIFDTCDLPTEFNSPYYRGHRPARDAAAVSLLRQAGAILIGKVSTVEFAGVGAIPETRNPHDLSRSPGGSSAGSGAAVAAGMVPLAMSSQTGGSTIRPAAFCGVAGFKPTWGRVPTEGMKPFSPSLDTVGWIAEDCLVLEHAARAFGVSAGKEANTRPLKLGLYLTPFSDSMDPATRSMLDESVVRLSGAGHEVSLVAGPDEAAALNDWQDVVMLGEGQFALRAEYQRNPDIAHPGVSSLVLNEKNIRAEQINRAKDQIHAMRPRFDEELADFDAWLAPAVPGIAPPFSEGNGLATFNRLFTALHVPCLTLPGPSAPGGLPLGIQLIGARDSDFRLLAAAQLIESALNQAGN